MINLLKTYFIALGVFLFIDLIWLVFIAKKIYADNLGYLMAKNPNYLAAGIFYLLFIIGLVYFVINPAVNQQELKIVIINGILFGLITYATYDLTNLATVNNWPLKITIIDLIWGMFISTSVSLITYLIVS